MARRRTVTTRFHSVTLNSLNTRTIPIATAVNESYILPLLVMLQSLQANLRPGWQVELHLLHRDLSSAALDRLGRDVRTHPICVSPAQIDAIPADSKFPVEAAFPLLLPELLPAALSRVLFLDADVLVTDDLALLWEMDIGEMTTGAVVDAAIPCCGAPRGVKRHSEFKVPSEAPYFNAGVLMVHLERWRNQQVAERALRYLDIIGSHADYFHQEALNSVIWDQWHPYAPRWNQPGALAGRAPKSLNSTPGIVHFSGRFKPWRCRLGGPGSDKYQQHLDAVLAAEPSLLPFARANLRDRLLGWYSRNLRDSCYGLERALWTRRWI